MSVKDPVYRVATERPRPNSTDDTLAAWLERRTTSTKMTDGCALLSSARRRRLLVPDKGGGLRKSKTSALAPYGEEPVGQGGASWCSSAVARRLSEARARAHPSNNLGGVCKLALLGRGELLVQVLGNVLALPIGNRDLFQRGARGILHEEIGRSSLRIGDLQALDPRCRISDEVLDRRVVPATNNRATKDGTYRTRAHTLLRWCSPKRFGAEEGGGCAGRGGGVQSHVVAAAGALQNAASLTRGVSGRCRASPSHRCRYCPRRLRCSSPCTPRPAHRWARRPHLALYMPSTTASAQNPALRTPRWRTCWCQPPPPPQGSRGRADSAQLPSVQQSRWPRVPGRARCDLLHSSRGAGAMGGRMAGVARRRSTQGTRGTRDRGDGSCVERA